MSYGDVGFMGGRDMNKKKEVVKEAKVAVVLTGLRYCQDSDDTEIAHARADEILCNFLIDLGYQNIVDEYEKVDKWYS